MKTFDLKTVSRQGTGKKATKQIRTEGLIPCVLYGGEKVIHFAAPINDFRHLIYTPHVYLVNLEINDEKFNAVIREIQFHPVSDKVLHIDFYEVTDNKPVEIGIPVVTTGFAKGVQSGGKLKIEMRRLKVSGIAKHLPDTLTIDVTKIGLAESIKVRDLSFPNLELLDPKNAVVVSVKLTRVAKGIAAEAGQEGSEELEEGSEDGSETQESTEE